MPQQNYSIGRDVTLSIVTDTGLLPLAQLTEFKSKQDTVDVKSKGIDGITRNIIFPDGWSGSFMVDRRNSNIDDYIAQLEADYYNSISHLPASISQTILEASGVPSKYRYTRVSFKLTDAGSWKGDALVKQSLDFVCEKRLKIA